MIHVDLMPEPPDFDSKVRQPGIAFLHAHPNSLGSNMIKYWRKCSNQLYSAYRGICAYTGLWFSPADTPVSVDHYYPKSKCPQKAYEWDNYRLTTQIMNTYKGDKIVLDPFVIENGDIVLDFPSCLVKPRKSMTPEEKDRAMDTIKILRLNDEEQANRRCEILLLYISGNISRSVLETKYPFIAQELERQGLYDKIHKIMKVPVIHTGG